MGNTRHPDMESETQVDLTHLLYASTPAHPGPASAFAPLSERKLNADVASVINARFSRHKPDGPA